MTSDLSIIIVSWNTRDLLRDCLNSVFAEPTGLKLQVLVADNASSDGSAEMVRQRFPQVRLIENKENLGFAISNNRLFKFCEAEYIVLLNPDTVVKNDALRILRDFIHDHPRIGAAGPKLVHPHLQLDVLGCGGQVSLRTVFNHYFFLARLFPNVPAFEGTHLYVGVNDREPRPVGWVSGACLVVRKAVIDQVGPMSERWFMYAEDQEWCARMIAAGWQVFHVPGAVVEHHLGASADKNPLVSSLPIRASRELYIQLQKPSAIRLWLFDAVLAAGCALRAAGYWMKGIIDRNARPMWHRKASQFLAYARLAIHRFAK